MGMIGRWIDEKCRTEPDVMRRVLNRKFGNLGIFFESGGKCGCLVGSWIIERGSYQGRTALLDDTEDALIGCRVDSLRDQLFREGESDDASYAAAIAVAQRRAVRILKQRIRKSLGLAPASRTPPVSAVSLGERPA